MKVDMRAKQELLMKLMKVFLSAKNCDKKNNVYRILEKLQNEKMR